MPDSNEAVRTPEPQDEVTGWLLVFRVPIVLISFSIAIVAIKGPTRPVFFEATATVIPVLLLALALESRFLTPGSGPGTGDLISSFSLLLLFGWAEAASLKAVANGHAPSTDGALVSAAIVAGFVGIGLGALTAGATPPTGLHGWLRHAVERTRAKRGSEPRDLGSAVTTPSQSGGEGAANAGTAGGSANQSSAT